MDPETVLEVGILHLIEIPQFLDFWSVFSNKKKLKNISELLNLCDAFQNDLLQKQKLDNTTRINISIIREQLSKLIFKKSTSKIYETDTSIKINDDWIDEYLTGLSNCLSGDSTFKEIKPRRYKTITELVQLKAVDGKKLGELYKVYKNKNHPLVNYHIGSILLNSKDILNGLPILKSALQIGFTYPNYYWHNSSAIEGIAKSLGLLIELLWDKNLLDIETKELKIDILKLYYLYASRFIYMTNSSIKSIDFYRHRAKIQKIFYEDFIGIYPFGVNPDIQYISDYYLAHQTCLKHNFGIETIARQLYFEAAKMYQHGSHIPNPTDGYRGIEEKNLVTCVSTGEKRSVNLANQIYEEFRARKVLITKDKMSFIFKLLNKKLDHNPEEFIQKLNNNLNR